jgi:hypothetical protein
VKKIKKEKKDREVTEKRKLSIVIKDFKIKSVTSQESSSTSRDKNEKTKERSKDKKRDKERDRKNREKEKKKSRDKKSNGSDFSLSDEETYRNFYEYHTSARWYDTERDRRERDYRVREWDRDKYYGGGRSRYEDDDRYSRYK